MFEQFVSCLARHEPRETKWQYPINCLYTVKFNGLDTNGSFNVAHSNPFLSPSEILPTAKKTNIKGYFRDFVFFFDNENVCCLYSLESHHRGDSNEYTQHTSGSSCSKQR